MSARLYDFPPPDTGIPPSRAACVDPRARVPERLDERRYPSGHVWRRYAEHERMVLRVIAGREL